MELDFEITKEKVKKAVMLNLIDDEMAAILMSQIDAPELYIPVHARELYFRNSKKYEGWRVTTEMIESVDSNGREVARAKTTIWNKDNLPVANGISTQVKGHGHINSDSHVEMAETKAKGRAYASLGIGVTTQFSSTEEMASINLPINSLEDISYTDEPSKEEIAVSKNIEITHDRINIIKKIEFFKIAKEDWSERYVSNHRIFIIRNHDSLPEKAKIAFDNLGFKVIKGIYKLKYKEKKE